MNVFCFVSFLLFVPEPFLPQSLPALLQLLGPICSAQLISSTFLHVQNLDATNLFWSRPYFPGSNYYLRLFAITSYRRTYSSHTTLCDIYYSFRQSVLRVFKTRRIWHIIYVSFFVLAKNLLYSLASWKACMHIRVNNYINAYVCICTCIYV